MEQFVKVRDSVALGAGVVLVGDAAANISSNTPVLLKSNNYFGYTSQITIESEKTVRKTKKAVSNVYSDIFTNTEGLTISCTYMEITPKAILYSLGGDGSLGITDEMIGSFGLAQEDQWLRLEMYFEYTNKKYQKIYVIPKVKVTSPFSDVLVQVEKGIENELEFQAVSAIDVSPRNVAWKDYPLGRVIFETM